LGSAGNEARSGTLAIAVPTEAPSPQTVASKTAD
jgi:hypothetical protein